MRTVRLRESSWTEVVLSALEVDRLSAVGKSLASQSPLGDAGLAEQPESDRSLVRLRKAPSRDSWQVYVADAIGAIGLGESQLIVSPKVPMDHFSHLALSGIVDPRNGSGLPTLSSDRADSFWVVVARWYLESLEGCLTGAAYHDYEVFQDSLASPRGRLNPVQTVENVSRGSLVFDCSYSDYTADNGINRVLVQAARTIAGSGGDESLRKRAAMSLERFPQMSDYCQADLDSHIDWSSRYANAFRLARLILTGSGLSLNAGSQSVGTFLVRTPSLVETGLRQVLKVGLKDIAKVASARKVLEPIGLTMNPDLVLRTLLSDRPSFVVNGGLVTGDIKYQVTNREWRRPHLYQAIAFASAFGAASGMILAFSTDAVSPVQKVIVGKRSYWLITWSVAEESTPKQSQDRMLGDCREALKTIFQATAAT